MKFTPEKHAAIEGFWIPEKDNDLVGVVEDLVAGTERAKPFFAVRASRPVRVRTQGEEKAVVVQRGARLGVSCFHQLKGLEKFKSHEAKIVFLGDVAVRSGRTMKTFDTEVSERPVPLPEPSSPAPSGNSGSGEDADDDIPF